MKYLSTTPLVKFILAFSSLCFLLGFQLEAQTPDFYQAFSMSKSFGNGISQPVDQNHTLSALKIRSGGAGVSLQLTDVSGNHVWSYQYKPGGEILSLEPEEIIAVEYGGSLKAFIAGTVVLPAAASENYWTSDFWLLEVEVATGQVISSRTFGSPDKDLCRGFVRARDNVVFNFPFGVIATPTFFLYGTLWDYQNSNPSLSPQDLLVVHADHQGNIIKSQGYAFTGSTSTAKIMMKPSDAVITQSAFVNQAFTIVGLQEIRTFNGVNASMSQRPFTIQISPTQFNNASAHIHTRAGVGFSDPQVRANTKPYIDFAPGYHFGNQHVITYTSSDNLATVMKLTNGQTTGGLLYGNQADVVEPAGIASFDNRMVLLLGERQSSSLYPHASGVLVAGLAGHSLSYHRFGGSGYPVPRSMEKWNGDLVAHLEEPDNASFGGFALSAFNSEGNIYNDCMPYNDHNWDNIPTTSTPASITLSNPSIAVKPLSVSRLYAGGTAYTCAGEFEYNFFGDDQYYGPILLKQGVASAEAEASEKAEIDWYPSPLDQGSNLHLSFESAAQGTASLQVFDVTGKEIFRQELPLTQGTNRFEIPAEHFPKGVSMAVLRGPNGIADRHKVVR